MNYKKYITLVTFSLVFLGIGIGAGYFVGFSQEHTVLAKDLNQIHPLRDYTASYKFISPLLAYVIPSADQETSLIGLKNTISNFIDSEKKTGGLSDASMFFYDLNRGRWVGVNERQKYNPASMLKVVIMVSYFKEAESNPSILDKNLIYTSAIDQVLKKDSFNSLSDLKINGSYTVEDLIEKMITDSDNGAEELLFNNISKNSLDAIYESLNIENPDNVSADFTISPRAYSLFFRIIYSATYLDRELSEKALDILSKTTFEDGIVAGLPTNLVVSHKFGEYVVGSNTNQVQSIELHDCGIVYYPKNPYFLCVMTKGNNIDELKSVIKNISSLVYATYASYK
jgi:beta-lactamase class A